MAELKDFLSELAINPEKLGEFIHDPESAMTAAELSNEDKAALRSGFPSMIYARLAGLSTQEAFQIPSRPSGAQQVGQQVFPQFWPQIFPQIFPQFWPQIFPQIFPQVWPPVGQQMWQPDFFLQIWPQIFPQVFPQVFPQIFPLIWPQWGR